MSASAREVIRKLLAEHHTSAAERALREDQEGADRIIAALSAAGFVVVPREPVVRAHTAFTCVMQWIDNWAPTFTQEDEWTGDEEIAAQALRDLDAMLSAAEGKK